MDRNPTILTAYEMSAWISDRRSRLARNVSRASAPAIRLLKEERITGDSLLRFAAREILDPDWRSGFLNPCTIVVRGSDASAGRLGLWERDGVLCLEMQSGGVVVVLREQAGELHLDTADDRAATTCPSDILRRLAQDTLRRRRRISRSADDQQVPVGTVIRFRTGSRRFSLSYRLDAEGLD